MDNKSTTLSQDRLDVINKIKEYERLGLFNEDVEPDPPSRMIMPDEIDYLRKKPLSKIKSYFAYRGARKFLNKLVKSKSLIVKEYKGVEHFSSLDCGAIITCNHFNICDCFAMHLLYEQTGFKMRKRKIYRVIREGNYTSFDGLFGLLMRHFYTLPLSSNLQTMKKFKESIKILLERKNFVLVYPEQSMWFNYRKPRPLKIGAFMFAAQNNAPVLPCFITMKDTESIGVDGAYIQEYTIHVREPIYPDPQKTAKENAQYMMDENYRVWKEIYEEEYGIPLVYDIQSKPEPQ